MSDEFVSLLLLLFFFERDESRNGTDDEKRLRSPSVSSFVIRFFFNFVRAFLFLDLLRKSIMANLQICLVYEMCLGVFFSVHVVVDVDVVFHRSKKTKAKQT